MSSEDNVLGETLSWLMKRAKAKNPDVGKAAHVDATTVSKWRNGVQRPDRPRLELLVEFFRRRGVPTSVEELLHGPQRAQDRAAVALSGTWDEARTVTDVRRVSEARAAAYGEVPFDSPTSRQRGRAWLEQFLLELAEAGASEDFIASSRRHLLSADNYQFDVDRPAGKPSSMTDDEKLEHMKGLADGIRSALRRRRRKRA